MGEWYAAESGNLALPPDIAIRTRKPRRSGASMSAAEWSRTITGVSTHKALNLARLPVPPQPLEGKAILDGRVQGKSAGCERPGEALALRTSVRRQFGLV